MKLKRIKGENRKSEGKLLEEKVAPLQRKLSTTQGELVCALTRIPEPYSFDTSPVLYNLKRYFMQE